MDVVFPVSDVTLRRVAETRSVLSPVYSNGIWQLNQREFAMQVEGVGSFYACNGDEVEYAPAAGASQASLELFLHGSVYGAILHQRNILPLHGSSFVWREQGVMICGESGSGKSSLTAAFCLDGATFLTDDVSPVVIRQGAPQVMPLSGQMKLDRETLQQLGLQAGDLTPVYPTGEKYLLPVKRTSHRYHPLHRVYIVGAAATPCIVAEWLAGIESFRALRNEVYRWEYLTAMPESEISHMEQLLAISRQARVARVSRHHDTALEEMMQFLKDHMEKNP